MNILNWIDKFSTDLRLKYHSAETQKNYKSVVYTFLKHFQDKKEPKAIDNEKIKLWILEAKTPNTMKARMCAITCFYKTTVGMPQKISAIPYPKSDQRLPIPLSQAEVQQMFDVCENLKHKTILALLYGCGFRVSELINLRWKNIDRSRMIINVIAGKGNKDRQVMLPQPILELLEKYWHKYKTKDYIFDGQFGDQYSSRSVGQVMKQLAEKAKINKRVYTHLMRHNCFTHMVENGIDINLIQRLAGHSNVKTTLLYTHISHNIVSQINSPINSIKL